MREDEAGCELCAAPQGEVVWRDALCRVMRVADPDYPGFCRVVWSAHVAEMTDLPGPERRHMMTVVFAVEAALRSLYHPDKVNLASFGNMVPHLHWHVVPRFRDDRHFPQPIFAAAQRPAGERMPDTVSSPALRDAIIQALSEERGGAA
jgi:diadenosine tetraphosphate (Ap4A) HIT family hydrolase